MAAEMPDPVVIFRGGKLVPFEEIPSQIGYIAHLNIVQRDCATAYCLIPCNGDAKNDVFSLKCEGFYKGRPGKSFPNALTIEMRCLGKEWHVKYFYSKGTLQICGARDYQEAEQISARICSLLNCANDTVKLVEKHREELVKAFDWLAGAPKGEECDTFSHFSLKNDEQLGQGKQRFCSMGRAASILWPAKVPVEHSRAVNWLREVSSDLTSYPEETPHDTLINRTGTILGLVPSEEPFSVSDLRCFGIVKYYDLGFTLNRYALSDELRRRGYDVSFDNVSGIVVTVHITSNKAFDAALLQRKKDKSGKETYRFNPGGVVDHHGCVDYMMADTFKTLMGDILSFSDAVTLR